MNPIRIVRHLTRAASFTIAALCTFAACVQPAFAQVPTSKTVTVTIAFKTDTVQMPGRVDTLRIPSPPDTVRRVDTVFVPAPVVTSPPKDTTTKTPSNPASILASATFEDSTYGSLFAETPGHLSIIADPTSSGHGKVMQVRYACGGTEPACIQPGTTRADLNQFASWNPTSGLSHGSTFYFKGQVYFPANTPRFTDGTLRKLIYFRTNVGSNKQFDYVINMFGTDVGLEISGPSQTDTRWSTGFVMPLGQWVTVEVSITTNSKPGAKDGATTVWMNGAQVLQKTGIAFTAASDPASTRWSWLAVGHQREGVDGDSTPISEVRYWDNLFFASTRP